MVYTLCDLLSDQARKRPAKQAIVDGQRSVSYADLAREVERFAAVLHAAGVQRGERVSVYLPRNIDSVVALFSIWSLGSVAVIVNEVLKPRQVKYIVDHSESSRLITDGRLGATLDESVIAKANIIMAGARNDRSSRASLRKPIGTDLGLIIYTSGSTGLPKGVMLSHANLLSGASIISDYLGLSESDRIISLLPFSFDYGLNQLLSSVYAGGTLVIERSVLPADICNTVQREHVTGIAGVPMLWQQLAHERSPFTRTTFPSLRYMTNTGGRMPEALTKLFRKAHPQAQIYLMFGLTEAFRSTFLPPDQVDIRPTSIGKAIPNVEILVINEKGELCGPGEEGELVHRGANISMGYWRDPASTAERFRPAPFQQGKGGHPEIAVYSGDRVKLDAEGYLYYIGRKDQMMKSHGFRVSPEEIEECIFSSGVVAHVVAFSVETGGVEGEIIAACVPRDSARYSEDELRAYCKREMPEYMRPKRFWPMKEFPQTSSGKPDRVRIKEAYLAAAGRG